LIDQQYGWATMPTTSLSLRDGASRWHRAWFRVARLNDCAVVSAGGELDVDSAVGLDDALKLAASSALDVLVDLSLVTFVDSSALGVLLGARARANQMGGTVALVRPPDLARRLLAGTVLQQAFPVHQTLGEAIDAALHRGHRRAQTAAEGRACALE
jgi:anti-sigma B factor antagonist